MLTYVLLTALALLLLLAVGRVLYVVGYAVVGIARESFEKKALHREFEHPGLGTIVHEDGLWHGLVHRNDREIPFLIAGSDTEPDPGLLGRLQSVLSRFSTVEEQALRFLRSREGETREMPLDLYMLDVVEENCPDGFTLEFVGEADGDRVWRVEFENGKPKSTGFDD